MISALTLYQLTTRYASPLIRMYLLLRQYRGKEDPARLSERFGEASCPRPEGDLWWLHAASVGEAMSLRPLLSAIRQVMPDKQLLLTSGTVSSANMLEDTLPDGVMHQFIPVDTPAACGAFLNHWQPELGVFTESELWPNLIVESQQRNIPLALINARMSEKSFRHWQILTRMASTLLGGFSLIAAQTTNDAERYTKLGGANIQQLGHLKQDAPILDVDEKAYTAWKEAINGRPCLVAASIHPDEDELMAALHQALKKEQPNLLTILVPRHPPRGVGMVQTCKAHGLKFALRSETVALPANETDCYIADTIGELGLWYRLADVVVMGGSFISHGGQNPLEAIRLEKPVIVGPHMHNFQTITDELLLEKGLIQVKSNDPTALFAAVQPLFTDKQMREHMVQKAKDWLENSPPVAQRLTEALRAIVQERAS